MHKTCLPKDLIISSQYLYQEAIKRGITCELFNARYMILMTYKSKSWYMIGSKSSLQSSTGRSIADSKPLAKEVFHKFSIPTAKYSLVHTIEAIDELTKLTFPLVMKPVAGRHGRGVIIGIENIDQAKNELKQANERVMFEEVLLGKEYRVTCVDYKFVACAYRKPAHIVGDGIHTVEELITEKNKHPWREIQHTAPMSKIIIDEKVLSNLSEQNQTLKSIPKKDKEIFLRKTSNVSAGGEAWNLTEQVCPENIELFEKIARVCDLNTIGIDVMCHDIAKPLMTQKDAGIIEVNASPGLRLHHSPLIGEPINVAEMILDMILEKYKLV